MKLQKLFSIFVSLNLVFYCATVEPMFDNILLIFVLGAYTLLIASMSVILLRHYKVRIKFFAGLLLFAWTLLNIKDLIIYIVLPESMQFNWLTMIDQLIVPCVGLTLYEMYVPRSTTNLKLLVHFAPFVALLVTYCIYPDPILINVSNIVVIMYSSVLIGIFVRSMKADSRSQEEKKRIYGITCYFVGILIIWTLTCIDPDLIWEIIYFVVSGVLWCIIYYNIDTLYKPKVEVLPAVECEAQPEEESVFAKSTHQFTEELRKLFEQDQIFLNSELALTDVARKIGTNRSYLSEYFNHELNTSFNDYVNSMRVSHAEGLILTNSTSSIEDIAVSSGFNSISTFRRAFIKKHGMTPSQYRQNRQSH